RGHVGLVGAEVHAEGPVGAPLHVGDGLDELGQRHRRRGQDAEPAGGAGRGAEPGPGDPAHAGLHDRVGHAEELAGAGAERHARASCLRWPSGSRTSRMRRSSSAVGARVSAAGPSMGTPVAACTAARVTPGCSDTMRIVPSGPPKSNTPLFETTRRSSWKRPPARSVPTPQTASTRATKLRGEWAGTQ